MKRKNHGLPSRKGTSLKCTNDNVISLVSKARKKKGFGKSELSRKLKLFPSYISLVEHDRATIPLSRIKAVCTLLDIPIDKYMRAYIADRKRDFMTAVCDK